MKSITRTLRTCAILTGMAGSALMTGGLMIGGAPAIAATGNPFMAAPTTTKVAEGVYQFSAGSNALLVVGDDSAVLVDTLFFNPEKLLAAVQAVTDKPVVYVIDTHAHRDHTGANALFAQRGARIVATPAAAARIAEPSTNARGEVSPPIDRVGWPTIKYAKPTDVKVKGVTARFIPVAPSHMDGDAMVFFPRHNVLVLGDLHHSYEYPVYDAQTGCKCGSYEGNLRVYRQALAMIDDRTKVIAGHGGVTDKAELQRYVAMLEGVRMKVKSMIDQGMSRDAVIAAKPLAGDTSVQPGGPDNADAFIGTLYTALATGEGA